MSKDLGLPLNSAVSLPGLDTAVLDRYMWESDRLPHLAERSPF